MDLGGLADVSLQSLEAGRPSVGAELTVCIASIRRDNDGTKVHVYDASAGSIKLTGEFPRGPSRP
jgi:hypothetical protein